MAPIKYCFMAGKAQEVQVRDVNIRSGWETLMAKCSRAIVTEVEGSAIQAHVAKPWWASVESHIVNEAGNLHYCFLTYLGPYWLALGEVRMLWLWLARNWPIWHGLHDHLFISSWNSVEFGSFWSRGKWHLWSISHIWRRIARIFHWKLTRQVLKKWKWIVIFLLSFEWLAVTQHGHYGPAISAFLSLARQPNGSGCGWPAHMAMPSDCQSLNAKWK